MMMQRILVYSFAIVLWAIVSCGNPTKELNRSVMPDATFYQYNIWAAFVNKVFDGHLKVSELKAHGTIGLGSFDYLDGELVMLDGIVYRVREDGTISEGSDDDEIVYADACFFKSDTAVLLDRFTSYDLLRHQLNQQLPTANHFYAFTIHGVFDSVTLGGLHKQSPPFEQGLDVLIPQRPVFTGRNVAGTMVGFFCPQFIGDINTAAYHFHFISDDRKLGGHVMDISADNKLTVNLQKLLHYQFDMPASPAFDTVRFDKQFQYNKR
jgi:acetolactate decarboxylase